MVRARIGALARSLRSEGQAVLDALLPPLCWLCRAARAVDGLGCARHALEETAFAADEARCPGCAGALPAGFEAGGAPAAPLCAACRRSPRGYRRLLAHGAYRVGEAEGDSRLREWILAFKHGGRADLALPLGVLLARVLRERGRPEERACLVPVPLHPLRRLERGHDQAAGLARAVGRQLGITVAPALVRTRWTPPQGAPGARSRSANVAGAFRVPQEPGSRAAFVRGRFVTLVDDVVTSGATAAAAAQALRAAGCAGVAVLALARVDRRPGQSGESPGLGNVRLPPP